MRVKIIIGGFATVFIIHFKNIKFIKEKKKIDLLSLIIFKKLKNNLL
jgi:hypothetical protein